MAQGPFAVPADRFDDLIALANRVFRARGDGDMEREYPLLFDRARLEQMRVILEDGRVVAHVGACLRAASVLGAPLRTVSIGAVGTHPDYRGRGFAGALMDDAIARAREWGAHLLLISGDRALYRRLGGCRPECFQQIEVPSAAAGDAGTRVVRCDPDSVPVLAALYQREPVRFMRPAEDWRRVLDAGRLMNQAAQCWLVRDADAPLAYVAVQAEGNGPPAVREYAGSREAVWEALGALARHYKADAIHVILMPGDLDLAARARRAGLSVERTGFHGTVRLLDVAGVVERVRALWIERHGAEAIDRLALEADRDGLSFLADGQRARLEGPAATTALFGPERGREHEAGALPGIAPLPLPLYGYNRV